MSVTVFVLAKILHYHLEDALFCHTVENNLIPSTADLCVLVLPLSGDSWYVAAQSSASRSPRTPERSPDGGHRGGQQRGRKPLTAYDWK